MEKPAGACDSGIHVYGPAFPRWPGSAAVIRPEADAAAYRAVQRRLGLSRVVVVQPNAYGFDNRCTLAALADLGPGARGTVTLRADVADATLRDMHAAGVRGARFHMLPGNLLSWDELDRIAARVAALGWHVQLNMDGRMLPDREAQLLRLPCKLLVDNLGGFKGPVDPHEAGLRSLLRLLDAGRCWLKLAGAYEMSRTGAPAYEDVALVARTALRAVPERAVWASNWPHVGAAHPPDDGALLAVAADWAGDKDTVHRVLVDNPAALFGFDPPG